MQRQFLLLFALALALAALACGSAAPDPMDAGSQAELQPLPDFSLQDAEGNQFTKQDTDGKVVLVNFWATWCGPCKIEMPWFVEFQRKYKDQGFTVLAVSLDDEGWDVVRPYAERHGFNFPVVVGDDSVSESFGDIQVLPTTLIVDKAGNIVYRHSGLVPKSRYASEIEALL